MPKQMTKAERAEYMRVYRARKKREEMRAGEIMAPRETPVSDTVDTSIAAACVPVPHHWCSTHQQRLVTERQCAATVSRETPTEIIPLPYEVTPEQIAFKRAEYERIKPSFLAAPDDDCAACGHDRQTYHLNTGGVCWAPAPNTRSRRCDCPSYVSAAEPF